MSGTFQLFNLVPETVSGYYSVLGFLVALNLVAVVIAKWSQPLTVRIVHANPKCSCSIFAPARCDTYSGINQLAWLVVGRSQVSD